MMQIKNVLGIIPARGGSKRLPRKNILPLAGKPLLVWTIEAALASATIDRLVVNTDDEEIAAVAKQYQTETVRRPAELATDTATTFDVIMQTLEVLKIEGYEPDAVVLLQATSPLRTAADISEAVRLYQEAQQPESTVMSVSEVSQPALAWSCMISQGQLQPLLGWEILTKRSQDVPRLYLPNGAVYVYSPKILRQRGCLHGPPLIPYVMPAERSIDIDTLEEFREVEAIMKRTL